MSPAAIVGLQRSPGHTTPETNDRAAPHVRSKASTEPGPDDPADWLRCGWRRVVADASTQVGRGDSGDTRRYQWPSGSPRLLEASTEPGPDDPGDGSYRIGGHCRTFHARFEHRRPIASAHPPGRPARFQNWCFAGTSCLRGLPGSRAAPQPSRTPVTRSRLLASSAGLEATRVDGRTRRRGRWVGRGQRC